MQVNKHCPITCYEIIKSPVGVLKSLYAAQSTGMHPDKVNFRR